jgi:hypothetical protein
LKTSYEPAIATLPLALEKRKLPMAPGIMCFGKKSVDSMTKRNDEIEKVLRADRKRMDQEIKMLLLGRMRGRYPLRA